MRLIVSALAIADQDQISEYTLDRWGAEQLDRYVGGLVDLFDLIAANPMIGCVVPKLLARFRRVAYGSHFVFYTVRPGAVRIECVIRQRMDHQRHLR